MKTAFDIGANIGNATEHYLKQGYKVISVEANDALCEKLRNRFRGRDVVVESCAVSSSVGELDFYHSNADTISTASLDWITKSRFTPNYKWNPPVKVKAVTLDHLIQKYGTPDIIKIDVEGYESEVISGLTNPCADLILFEWAEEEFSKVCKTCSMLQNLGYSKFGYTNGDSLNDCPTNFSDWDKCELHSRVIPSRKELWGMIYAKK
jgi:FkbM family methyltransferase